MSTGATSSSRRLAVRTYGRSKESTSRAFDEAVAPKPAHIKAATTHTKWGKTNFIALRESQRLKGEVLEGSRKVKQTKNVGDPFSFDEDASKRNSPVKKQTANANIMGNTRLPGTRIMTRSAEVKKDVTVIEDLGDSSVKKDDDDDPEVMFNFESKVSKTYSRAPFNSKPEPKKQSTDPKCKESVKDFGFGDLSDEEEVSQRSNVLHKMQIVEHSIRHSQCDYQSKPPSSKQVDDNSDDDIFPVQFMKKPQKTYGSRYSSFDTSSSSSFTSSPVVETVDVFDDVSHKTSTVSKSPRKRVSKYNDPVLLEEYKKQYALSKGLTGDTLYKLDNSVVISKAEIPSGNQKGKTVIVVCKPKMSGKKEKKDVQSKYFRMSQDFSQFRSNLIADVVHSIGDSAPKGDADVSMEDGDTDRSQSQNDCVKSSSSQDSAPRPESNNLASHRNKHSVNPSPRNSAASSSQKQISRSKNTQDSVKYVPSSSSQESVIASDPEAPVLEKVVTLKTESDSYASEGRRTPTISSGGKKYKIFKSRGPPKPQYIEYALPEDSMPDSPEPPVLSPVCESTPLDISEQSEEQMELSATEKVSASEVDDFETVEDVVPSKRQKVEGECEGDSQGNPSDGSLCSHEDSPSSISGSQQSEPEHPKSRRFFKSKSSKSSLGVSDLRRRVLQSPGKSPSKAVYNARSWQETDNDAKETSVNASHGRPKKDSKSKYSSDDFGDDSFSDELKVSRKVHWQGRGGEDAYTSLRVSREHRQLFTVVRNVKQAFEVQESGETQEFTDDVEYLLDGLRNTEPVSIRCLSCIQMATKCTMPAFRMHLRAHGTVTKIFTLLHDACTDPSLALSTAAMMYMLSRDRLNMDLETDSLNLMLRLLEFDSEKETFSQLNPDEVKELEKTKTRVQDLIKDLKHEETSNFETDTISTGYLAMESLLSLTSRRAGEWFKEELRTQGALDHIVDMVSKCSHTIIESLHDGIDSAVPSLRRFDRCLRVLENVSFLNVDNQSYLLSYKHAELITAECSVLKVCQECISAFPVPDDEEERKSSPGVVLFNCILAILRVLLNLTHENELGSTKVGEQDGLLDIIVVCLLTMPKYVPLEHCFDMYVLGLGLMINMAEHCEVNRRRLMTSVTTIENTSTPIITVLIKLFLQREEAARNLEEDESQCETLGGSPNKSGEWHESEQGMQWIAKSVEKVKKADDNNRVNRPHNAKDGEDDEEETFLKALHKASKHMENSIIAAYVGLLIGCLIQDNSDYVEQVRDHLPNRSYEPVIRILKKFLGFMNLTNAVDNTGAQKINQVIEVLEAAC
ncbi:LOW QUALITY PROTEIN: wings apart-like protein homolog [Gigantopelta aegis]|uniref:LOW QUALITY PROTEIN: wings apart-like protein homolog n=1 Tax=Gigantopelta aegis TaxID=1735272 RepID=UPI001B889E14|nr:LOW QUALITY PROTEIN: wings apart-like protein homolog [Gigantopelta aegis]